MRLQHALQRGALGGPLRCPGNLVIRLGRYGVDINNLHVSFTIARFYLVCIELTQPKCLVIVLFCIIESPVCIIGNYL